MEKSLPTFRVLEAQLENSARLSPTSLATVIRRDSEARLRIYERPCPRGSSLIVKPAEAHQPHDWRRDSRGCGRRSEPHAGVSRSRAKPDNDTLHTSPTCARDACRLFESVAPASHFRRRGRQSSPCSGSGSGCDAFILTVSTFRRGLQQAQASRTPCRDSHNNRRVWGDCLATWDTETTMVPPLRFAHRR